ncbi:MAG: hypothetical protein OXB86_04530 [Bdellovibrionales bacterium]|nr:hypothetical protein [Bdellovibrionales bacterium]
MNLITRIFYGLTAIGFFAPYLRNILKNWHWTMEELNGRTDWIWSVSWMSFIPEKFPVVLAFVLAGFLFSMIGVLFPHKKWLRVFVFLLVFQSLALKYSPIKIGHSSHILLFTSFWLIFINLNNKSKELIKEQNKLYLWAIQVSFLGAYFLTGLWKLRDFMGYLMKMDWSEIPRCLGANFADEYISYNLESPFYEGVLKVLEWPFINHLLWLGVILFQVCVLVVAWFPPLQRVCGLLIILFHVSTFIFMDLRFLPNQYIALIFLVCHPYQRKR